METTTTRAWIGLFFLIDSWIFGFKSCHCIVFSSVNRQHIWWGLFSFFFQVHEFLPHSAKRYLRFPVWEECHLLWQWAGTTSSSRSPAQGKTHLYTHSSGQKSIFLVSGTLSKCLMESHHFLHKYCLILFHCLSLYWPYTGWEIKDIKCFICIYCKRIFYNYPSIERIFYNYLSIERILWKSKVGQFELPLLCLYFQHIKAHKDPIAMNHSFYEVIMATSSASQKLQSLRNRCLMPGIYVQHLSRWLDFYPARQVGVPVIFNQYYIYSKSKGKISKKKKNLWIMRNEFK